MIKEDKDKQNQSNGEPEIDKSISASEIPEQINRITLAEQQLFEI